MSKKENVKMKFRDLLAAEVSKFRKAVSTDTGDWKIKGFIDVDKKVYTISLDTKVLSKIMELILFPHISKFADANNYELILSKQQNSYPDFTLKDKKTNLIFAIDFKSTYRKTDTKVNGMTLGAFTGYFRNRSSTKNITAPYESYTGHYVLGLIYSRSLQEISEVISHNIEDIGEIQSVVSDIDFFIQEKYKVAIDRPGSGNTKNIGATSTLSDLKNGNGPFSKLGESTFDDYWMNYLTKEMAKSSNLPSQPYKNLKEYIKLKKL